PPRQCARSAVPASWPGVACLQARRANAGRTVLRLASPYRATGRHRGSQANYIRRPGGTDKPEGNQMSQPVIFVIDDDTGVTAALREDIDRRFGGDFRVIGESSAGAGLATLRGLADAGEPVALLIVDHDLSAMPGAEFLARAREMHPLAKRVLLVERDYSAHSPVIPAMTLGQADYHLAKPWVLEQDLYRLISEFLAEWAKDHQAGFDLFQVVGLADRDTHELRELLTRFGVPFRFHSAGSRRGRELLRAG